MELACPRQRGRSVSVQQPGDRETHVLNQNQSQSRHRRYREGLRLWKWEGRCRFQEEKLRENCPGKSECLQAPGNQCPQLCCFPLVSLQRWPSSVRLRPTRGVGWGQDPGPRCSHWKKRMLDCYLKDEEKLDGGSDNNQDDAAFTGQTRRCSFPGHHPHQNTGREGRTSHSILSQGWHVLSGLSKQAECSRRALRTLKTTI